MQACARSARGFALSRAAGSASRDGTDRRLLIWNQIPTVNGAPADTVFGQADMNSVEPVPVTISQNRFEDGPEGLFVDDLRIIIGDAPNYRILFFPNF